MKKLACLLFLVLHISGISQNTMSTLNTADFAFKPVSTPTVVTDTLHYYLNKYYYKTAITNLNSYPYIETLSSRILTPPPITLYGSRFDLPVGETLTVTGLEAYLKRLVPNAGGPIPITLYLCELNSQSMPVLPAIDSIQTALWGQNVYLMGGNLATARTMTTNFAVLFRNSANGAGEKAGLLRTNGAINSNWQAAGSDRCSDGNYGYVYYNNTFYSTREFTMAPGFGQGTDYEFMIAPRVTYTVQASHTMPQGVYNSNETTQTPDTFCTRSTQLKFTNTSSAFYEHRMYNLNQFYRKWNLYDPFTVGSFSADSSISWKFEFNSVTPKVLPYVNNGTLSVTTDDGSKYPACFNNQFSARLKSMSAFGRGPELVHTEPFKTCFKYCITDAVGISSVKKTEKLNVYPNPAVNGISLIKGLEGENTITVYNTLGQVILTKVTESNTFMIDLSQHPQGSYLIRVFTSDNQNKTVKIIHHN